MSGALAERVGRILSGRSLVLAAAESCTGGLLCATLTSVPGSSAYFRGGVVAYDNAVKEKVLFVPEGLIARHGAVSGEVAAAMAEGVARALGAQVGVGITGIAGPTGGSPEKPVGTVWISVVAPKGRMVRHFLLPGDRESVREGAVERGLLLLLEILGAGEWGR